MAATGAHVQAPTRDFPERATVSFCYARARAESGLAGMWREEVTAALRSAAAALPTTPALPSGRGARVRQAA